MTRYAKSKQEALRERMFKFYLENQSEEKTFFIFQQKRC